MEQRNEQTTEQTGRQPGEQAPGGGGRWKREGTRLIFILLFAVIFNIAEIVLTVVVAVQFLSRLITGRSMVSLLTLGRHLAAYIGELIAYLTYNADVRPYPFAPWPTVPGAGPEPETPGPAAGAEPGAGAEQETREPGAGAEPESHEPGR